MDWLHQAQTARQNCTRQSHMKKLLVLSGFLLFSIELYLRMVYYFFEQLVHCLLLIRYVWFIFFQVSGPKHGLLHVHGLLNVKSISQRPSNTYD